MLTRSGPLQDHFRLRDSVRELVLVDDASAEWYRCLIQIDSQSGRVSSACTRFRDENRALNGGTRSGADGSTAEYERVVDELWGPRSLYLLSVVTPQKPITIRMKGEDGQTIPISTDIGQAPKGQRRAVLRQLLGLGAYQAASRSAVERASGHEATYQESLQTAGHYDADAERVEAMSRPTSTPSANTERKCVCRQGDDAAETLENAALTWRRWRRRRPHRVRRGRTPRRSRRPCAGCSMTRSATAAQIEAHGGQPKAHPLPQDPQVHHQQDGA